MSLDATLQALTVPSGTEFPGSMQDLLGLIAQYVEVTGLNPFNGINYGSTTPDAPSRDRPWFKTDPSGDPVGWHSWDGSTWTPIPQTMPVGTTAQRPASPPYGTQFFDTDIAVSLIYERGIWRTLSGSPGDVKFVKASTLDAAILKNPGWAQDPDSVGRVIGAADDDNPFNTVAGQKTTLIAVDNLPPHDHTYNGQASPARWKADGNATDAAGALAGWAANSEQTSGATGEQTEVSVMNPTIYFWALYKL